MNSKLEEHQSELLAQQEELRRQTTELERRNAEAESAVQQKSELLLRMSSKLRTPLNAVIGYAELLLASESGPLTPQQREFIDAIASAQREQLGLITDTVDWSEMEAGHLKLAPEALSIEDILGAARDAIAPQATRKQITVLTSCTASQPVFADARRVHQVLLHILSNAVKFSACGSTVQLTASSDHPMIAFEVADRGPGLPDELWPRLFQPFQQAESPLVDGYEGTGLGLAVCKRLVEAQGGAIAARPHEGGGSSFGSPCQRRWTPPDRGRWTPVRAALAEARRTLLVIAIRVRSGQRGRWPLPSTLTPATGPSPSAPSVPAAERTSLRTALSRRSTAATVAHA
jgi:signal transduction histidine kinase